MVAVERFRCGPRLLMDGDPNCVRQESPEQQARALTKLKTRPLWERRRPHGTLRRT